MIVLNHKKEKTLVGYVAMSFELLFIQQVGVLHG